MDEKFTSDASEEWGGGDDGGKSEPPPTFLSALEVINTEEMAHEV
jgi:hypothetical protein